MVHRFKHKTIKHLEENIRENPQGQGLGGMFLDMTLKAWSIKEKNNYLEMFVLGW